MPRHGGRSGCLRIPRPVPGVPKCRRLLRLKPADYREPRGHTGFPHRHEKQIGKAIADRGLLHPAHGPTTTSRTNPNDAPPRPSREIWRDK